MDMQKHTSHPPPRLNWDDLRYFLQVARTGRVSGAASTLHVDHTTVARRIRELEAALDTVLFEKSRARGFVLTAEGERLLGVAEAVETAALSVTEQFIRGVDPLSGQVRIGSTEGFGSFFLAPHLERFQSVHAGISLELLPVPYFVSLSNREADITITLERPNRGQYVLTKLCDYRLRLYATEGYLSRHPVIVDKASLMSHHFISYVDDLAFSSELLYLSRTIPEASSNFRSTSIIAQYFAALQGRSLAILPCFMASTDPRLVQILPDEVEVTRCFWMCCREDLRKLRRIAAVWDYLRELAVCNRAFLLGESTEMIEVGP